jgi:hypothetical protein
MKRKMVCYINCILLFLILINTTGCAEKKEQKPKTSNGLKLEIETGTDAPRETQKGVEIIEMEKKPMYKTVLYAANRYGIDETVNIEDIEYSDLKIKKSKTLPEEIRKEEIMFQDEDMDENGNLIDGKCYVCISILITNKAEKKETLYLNSNNIVSIDDDGKVTDSSIEDICFRSDYIQNDPYKRDYYKLEIPAGESTNVRMLYVVTDMLMDSSNLYYMINQGGHEVGYEGLCGIELSEVIE